MNAINVRIADLISQLGIKKTAFAEQINVSQPFVSGLCAGTKQPSDRTISDICRVFSVSEDWLRYGEGEMLVPLTRDQEIADFMGEVLTDPDASPRKALICAVKKLGPEEWATLAKVAREWVEGMEKSSEN